MELLVTTALLGVVLAVVVTYYPLGGNYWSRSAALGETQQHARIALEEVLHELQYAHRIQVEQHIARVTYWKEVDGKLKRYRLYQWGQQLLVDLPEGTAVPVAGSIEVFGVEPNGRLEAGDVLTLTVRTAQDGYGTTLTSALLPRNLQVWSHE